MLAVNHLTAAVIRHPAVADGINTAIGGALVLGVVSSGLSLGLAAGALLAALFFLAAIFVMKIALTAMLCVLLVSGALVLALLPLPQGEGLARLWGAGLLAAVTIPVSWALVFAVVGLVASDALVGHGLGPGLEAAVKPFVAVACLYLVYKTPGFLVAQARMLGVRLGRHARGWRAAAPGEARLRRPRTGTRRCSATASAGSGRRPASREPAGRAGGAASDARPPRRRGPRPAGRGQRGRHLAAVGRRPRAGRGRRHRRRGRRRPRAHPARAAPPTVRARARGRRRTGGDGYRVPADHWVARAEPVADRPRRPRGGASALGVEPHPAARLLESAVSSRVLPARPRSPVRALANFSTSAPPMPRRAAAPPSIAGT